MLATHSPALASSDLSADLSADPSAAPTAAPTALAATPPPVGAKPRSVGTDAAGDPPVLPAPTVSANSRSSSGDASFARVQTNGPDAPVLNVSIVNLPYRAECGGLDSAVLEAFLREREVEAAREYFYVVDGRPHLCCWIEWRSKPAPPSAGKRRASAERSGSGEALGEPPDDPLDSRARAAFDALREWRLARAREKSVPAYRVFTDRVLKRIARKRPANRAELGAIEGVSAAALEAWADQVLGVLDSRRESSSDEATRSSAGARSEPVPTAGAVIEAPRAQSPG